MSDLSAIIMERPWNYHEVSFTYDLDVKSIVTRLDHHGSKITTITLDGRCRHSIVSVSLETYCRGT